MFLHPESKKTTTSLERLKKKKNSARLDLLNSKTWRDFPLGFTDVFKDYLLSLWFIYCDVVLVESDYRLILVLVMDMCMLEDHHLFKGIFPSLGEITVRCNALITLYC